MMPSERSSISNAELHRVPDFRNDHAYYSDEPVGESLIVCFRGADMLYSIRLVWLLTTLKELPTMPCWSADECPS